jgi:DnaJ family protein C protein 28
MRLARCKLDEQRIPTEGREGDRSTRGGREWRDLVEQRIQDAMAAGSFDNLQGEGKPLNLPRNPYLDPSLELAYGLLKNNGFAPEWIVRDKEIREQLEAARARLRAAWARRRDNPADEIAWQAALARYDETLTQLNRKIDDFNLIVPIPSCQRVRLKLADELRQLPHE